MKIYVIRHGETNANLEGRLQGHVDIPLNENGVRLAKITGEKMKGIKFQAAFSSPLIRAKETAQLVLDASGNEDVPLVCDERIAELYMGLWEGKKFKGADADPEVDQDEVKEFFVNPLTFKGCPEGENVRSLMARTQEFIKDLAEGKVPVPCSEVNGGEMNFLVATHGCALRAMLNFLYDNKEDFWHGHVPYNCAVNILDVTDGVITLESDDKIYYDMDDVVDRYGNK